MISHAVADSTNNPVLDYGKAAGLRRRYVGVAIFVTLVIVIAIVAYLYGRVFYKHARQWQLRRELLAWREPANRVVYEPDEVRCPALRNKANYEQCWGPKAHVARRVPQWQEYRARAVQDVPLFLHGRTTPGGTRHLVVVYFQDGVSPQRAWIFGENFIGLKMNLQYEVDGTPGVARVLLPVPGWDFEKPRYTRFFAGQPDADDPALFTIAYEIGEHQGVIDGRLIGGNMVNLDARPATTQPLQN